MRDLVQRAGLPAATIHFYAQQGLLPVAVKTAENQARYPEGTLRRLLWIRSLQQELRLSLRGISWILQRHGELPLGDIRALQALGSLLDGGPDAGADVATIRAVRERLEPGDIETLRRLELISDGLPTGADVRLLELCAAIRGAGFTEEAGFSIEQIAVYRDAVERLVTEELRRIIEPLLQRHEATALRDMVRGGLPFTNQVLSLLHERAVQGELQRWLELDTTADTPQSTTA